MGLYSINRRASVIGGTGFGGRQQAPLIARGQMFAGYDIPPQEVAELYKLFTQTGGQSWIDKTNWFENKTCATWFGLTVAGGRVTVISIKNNNMVGNTLFNPKPFAALTTIEVTSNADLVLNLTPESLPQGFLYLDLYSTSSRMPGMYSALPASMTGFAMGAQTLMSGTAADLPAELTMCYLEGSPSTITGAPGDFPVTIKRVLTTAAASAIIGDLSEFPAPTYEIQLQGSASRISGGALPIACTKLRTLNLNNCNMTQESCDSLVNRIYADRALFTATAPSLNIGGTNPDPTGVYQTSANPATPLEKVYALVNDQNAEGFKKWAINY